MALEPFVCKKVIERPSEPLTEKVDSRVIYDNTGKTQPTLNSLKEIYSRRA